MSRIKNHHHPTPSPSPCSGLGPVVTISHGAFHSRLKVFLFSKSFHSQLSFRQAHLLEIDQSVFGSHWRR